ncbi:hypothetical protein RN001_015037 [Aquatica leii]|uniref:Uncharacterized protein n=1 Tax=Aquatica leii TaxID=1421715 RepID=A0AAN7P1A4_9COLE|nr:hypothetical protein RN001_015037 [Aquatica leii]
MCKWPPKHEGGHILKYSVPKPDWVRCERICGEMINTFSAVLKKLITGSREEARKKCIRNSQDGSSTGSDMGRKSRKKQLSKFLVNYYTGCPSPPHLDDDTDNEDTEHFSREAGHNPYMGVSGDLPEATQDLALPEVEEVLVYQENGDRRSKIEQTEWVQYLQHIGGMSAKDLRTRCYKQLFTNAFCEECSWKSFRQNFKMKNLTVTKCLYDMLLTERFQQR